MEEIKIGDYVITNKDINGIRQNSVGLVKSVSGDNIVVFFVGKGKKLKVNSKDVSYLDVKKTGKPYEMKICNICHILKKDMVDFDVNQTDAKGRKTTRPSCKVCRVAIDGDRFIASEKKRMDATKPKDIFTCPICNKTTIVGVTANLVKDHDHLTGMGREWICDSCNTGLGRFKDDKLLQVGIDYLKKYS